MACVKNLGNDMDIISLRDKQAPDIFTVIACALSPILIKMPLISSISDLHAYRALDLAHHKLLKIFAPYIHNTKCWSVSHATRARS